MDNHITLDQLDQAVWSLVQKINSKEIPENVSELNNDTGYITIDQVHIPTYTSELTNDSNFITLDSNALNNGPFGYISTTLGRRLILGDSVKYSSNSNSINEFIFIKQGGNNIVAFDTHFYNIQCNVLSYVYTTSNGYSSTSSVTLFETTSIYLDGVNTNDLYFRNVPAGIYLATLTNGRLDLTTYATQSYVDSAISSLTAADVGALPSSTVIPTVPTNVSAFTNDAGYLTGTEISYPVTSVNGDTGAVTIDEIQTTAGENNVEYDLIGTAPANTNSGLVPLYKPTLLTFAKTTNYGRLTLGSSDTPGVLRIYSSTTNASGYTDLKTSSSSTNTRTITFPDATGTVALTSDIPSVSSWALAANKPSYTFSELTSHPTSIGGYGITDAYTKTEVDGKVSGVLHYKGTKATVSALPDSGNTTGDTWHVTADGSEWAWDGSDWQELGTAVDLSGYVPTSRTVNGKALTSDISLTASDVSALPSNTTYVSSFNGESGAITYTAPVTSVNGQTGAVTITDNDEKLKTTELDNHSNDYAVLLGLSNATASTKYYDSGIKYRNRDDEYTARLTLGVSGTGTGRRSGQIAFYVQDTYCILRKNDTTKSGYYVNLPASGGTIALTSDIPTSASDVGALPSNTTYVSSINGQTGDVTLTIPDADDHKWGGVALAAGGANTSVNSYVPSMTSMSNTTGTAKWATVTYTPTNYCIAKYDDGPYLYSTTPSATDNSTKVATTAFVGTAIAAITASDVGALADDSVAAGITSTDISNWNAKLSSFTETDPTVPAWAKESSKPTYTASEVGAVPAATSGPTGTGYVSNHRGNIAISEENETSGSASLSMIGPTVVLSSTPNVQNASITLKTNNVNNIVLSQGQTTITGVVTPTNNTDAANKQYVDTAISGISVPQPYNATTNPTGYLRITDLPIYDGTVV